VIIGGGFGGLEVAKRLRKADVRVTLIDRNNYHLFQPLLYQVGPGGLAIQQGKYVADAIKRKAIGKEPRGPFRYRDLGSMATIGRAAAVAQIGRLKFRGLIAWILWLAVHLIQIIQVPNRLLILIQWAWNYLTFNRSARIITGTDVGRNDSPRRVNKLIETKRELVESAS
jgi:NADH dehydrogenase FAD-containing subunit